MGDLISGICEDAPFVEKCFQYPDAFLSIVDVYGIVFLGIALSIAVILFMAGVAK